MRCVCSLPLKVFESGGPILQLSGARRRFGENLALDGVTLNVEAGEIYALLGRNGAGKSTLAKAAVGAIGLDEGSVRVSGADPIRDRAVRRTIGVAPQEIALYPRLSISENLAVLAAIAGVPRRLRGEAVAFALRQAACSARADERIERLSGGWKRRANLAAALVHRPRLLVLDEPSEGLDAETRAVLSGVLRSLRDDGVAVLLISHDALEVAALAGRIGVMHRGRLLTEGAPAELLSRAFGAREELILHLGAMASPETGRWLSHIGLTPCRDPTAWAALVDDAAVKAREVHDGLTEIGVAFRELTVRPPSLDQLISHVTDQAAA